MCSPVIIIFLFMNRAVVAEQWARENNERCMRLADLKDSEWTLLLRFQYEGGESELQRLEYRLCA